MGSLVCSKKCTLCTLKEAEKSVRGMVQFEAGDENNFEVGEELCVIYPRINAKDIPLFSTVERC